MRSHNGFTLIEMLVVLVILGMVVAFAAPKIDTTRYRVQSSMNGIGMTLMAVERQAITQQHDVILMFDVPNSRIRVLDDANNNGIADAGERLRGVPLGDGIVFSRATAVARPMGAGPVTFTKVVGGMPALVFHRDGSASEAGGFYLTSNRAATSGTHLEDTRSIELERATGRASWWKYSPAASAWVRAF